MAAQWEATQPANQMTDQSAGMSDEAEHFRRVFVGGLNPTTTNDTLKEFFGKFGDVVKCEVACDRETGKARGYGFVVFAKKAGVDQAMKNRPHEIDGKIVDSKRALPRDPANTQNIPSKRLYVGGIREEITEHMLRGYFSKFGNVEKVDIVLDKDTGKPRGFAFILFNDTDPVDLCVLYQSHYIASFRCDVKKALSKAEMAHAQQSLIDRQMRSFRGNPNFQYYGFGGPRNNFAQRAPRMPHGGGDASGSFREPHGTYGVPAYPPQYSWPAYQQQQQQQPAYPQDAWGAAAAQWAQWAAAGYPGMAVAPTTTPYAPQAQQPTPYPQAHQQATSYSQAHQQATTTGATVSAPPYIKNEQQGTVAATGTPVWPPLPPPQ